MHWMDKGFLLAAGVSVAATLSSYSAGFGWLTLIAATPALLGAIILVPFFLGRRDRQLAIEKRRLQGRRRRGARRRMTRPAPAAPNKAGAPLAERGGRARSALPAAPL